ncbi:MAG: hypothetical protein R2806_16415 [Saprospiraceae bacterium]
MGRVVSLTMMVWLAAYSFGQDLIIERTTVVRVQGLSIEETIRRLESLYGMQFAYSPDRLPLNKPFNGAFRKSRHLTR